jgi:ribosomal protein L11 methyltransferase
MKEKPQNRALHAVRVRTHLGFADIAETGLAVIGMDVVTWRNIDTGDAVIERFLASRHAAVACAAEIRRRLREWAECGETWRVSVHRLPPEDWALSYRRFFRAARVSDRLIVRPPWEAYPASSEDRVIVIDPGMSFGTGQHATTRACLRYLDRIAERSRRNSFLDIGCGSGILAIAAAKLGFAPVLAVDSDPAAVAATRKNSVVNGVSDKIVCREADAGTLRLRGKFGVVAANLHSGILERHADGIGGRVSRKAGSALILSGVLNHQYRQVRDTYEQLGFRQVDVIVDGEWTTGRFSPSPPA